MTDARGKRLLSMTAKLLKNRAVIHLDRDGDLTLQGNAWGRGFTIRDAGRGCLVRTSSPQASPAAAHHPDDAVLVEIPGVLDIAEVIAVVQIWRTARKAAIASSTAASSTVARGM